MPHFAKAAVLEQGALTGAIGQRAHEGRQHFHRGRGVGVSAQPFHHLSLESSHHIQQDIVREAQLVQKPVNLQGCETAVLKN